MRSRVIAIGLMSGTSLDGIDAALVEIVPAQTGYALTLLRFETCAFEESLLQAIAAALPPNEGSVAAVATLHRALGNAFAAAAKAIAGTRQVSYVASHGQTLWHDGRRQTTLQVGDPFAIRDAVEATVCFDFRSADCAAGGHGAPLVPYVDALLFANEREARVALNVGGIANATLLPKGSSNDVVAFDTGPGNMLIDALVSERTAGAKAYDRNGELAARGRVDEALLARMLSDEYFDKPPPKTTGRERFGRHFLARFSDRLAQLSTEDAAATLTELTAVSIARAVAGSGMHRAHIIVSGGGACNPELLARLSARLGEARVERSDAMGIPVEAKEAIAFAVLGYETLRGRPANAPRATGAKGATMLGAIAPYDLVTLLAAVERECAQA